MNIVTKDNQRDLHRKMSQFQGSHRWKSIWQLVNTLFPLGTLTYLAYWSLDYSYWLTLPTVAILAGFMIRTFIIFHDCGHHSFFKSKTANDIWGILTGLLTTTPYHSWRASHARHHSTSGNLDKRGDGDVWLMTTAEFREAPRGTKIKYRLYRNPFIMFFAGAISLPLLYNRIVSKNSDRIEKLSVHLTNLALAILIASIILIFGWKIFVIVWMPALLLAHLAGVWLFYVQHQFEGVYWERDNDWDFVAASLEGGSYYRLPGILRWFSGNIGFHHVHHLNSTIPNYNLPKCQKNIPVLQEVRSIGLISSFKSLKFRLYDEETGRLISFREFKQTR